MNSILNRILAILIFTSFSFGQNSQNDIQRVADKIINETTFEFYPKEQSANDELQIVNFPQQEKPVIFYAKSILQTDKNSFYNFGISSTSPIKIWINNQVAYESNLDLQDFKTIAYDMYEFPEYFSVELKQGENEILVKSVVSYRDYFALASVDNDGMINENVSFELPELNDSKSENHKWLFLGPISSKNALDLSQKSSVEKTDSYFYLVDEKFYNWFLPQTNIILDDVIKDSFSFTKHSYFEWHYANGQMMLGMLALADLTKDQKYYDYIKKFCDLTLNTFDYFKYQYEDLNERSGFNHRLFRRTMLDDTGAPALPFIELFLKDELDNAEFIVDTIADYIMNKQFRLPDDTFARPEPRKYTVWADDLFMSVPFLLRYAQLTNNQKYFDEAAKQIILFNERLFDPGLNLYFHGWFSDTKENSIAHWGRANGWFIWAVTEALIYLPKDHKYYDEILSIYKKHVEGLIAYQSDSGMWHQVIDKPESYEETSSSAMFTLGIARGVLNGWLDKSYGEFAINGWNAISNKIEKDGTVLGICRGTGIGFDLEFYYSRETPPNDPRGLGAVLTAGVEVSKLLNRGEN